MNVTINTTMTTNDMNTTLNNDRQKSANNFWHKCKRFLFFSLIALLLLPFAILSLIPIVGTLAVGIIVLPILIITLIPIIFLIYKGIKAMFNHLEKRLQEEQK